MQLAWRSQTPHPRLNSSCNRYSNSVENEQTNDHAECFHCFLIRSIHTIRRQVLYCYSCNLFFSSPYYLPDLSAYHLAQLFSLDLYLIPIENCKMAQPVAQPAAQPTPPPPGYLTSRRPFQWPPHMNNKSAVHAYTALGITHAQYIAFSTSTQALELHNNLQQWKIGHQRNLPRQGSLLESNMTRLQRTPMNFNQVRILWFYTVIITLPPLK
jgi:hypothetical protein